MSPSASTGHWSRSDADKLTIPIMKWKVIKETIQSTQLTMTKVKPRKIINDMELPPLRVFRIGVYVSEEQLYYPERVADEIILSSISGQVVISFLYMNATSKT